MDRHAYEQRKALLNKLSIVGLVPYGVAGLGLHAFLNPGNAVLEVFDEPRVAATALVVGGAFVILELVLAIPVLLHTRDGETDVDDRLDP
jgi:hypothetical protein